jgi:hypothetical protein
MTDLIEKYLPDDVIEAAKARIHEYYVTNESYHCGFTDVKPFKEIWEQEHVWLEGPGIISDIVTHLKSMKIVGRKGMKERSTFWVDIQLPALQMENNSVDTIYRLIPDHLLYIFEQRLNLLYSWYSFINTAVSDCILADITDADPNEVTKQGIEIVSTLYEAYTEKVDYALWEHAADAFGLDSRFLPEGAGSPIIRAIYNF